MIMRIKALLRRLGYDIVRYRPVWGTLLPSHGIQTVLDIGANDGSTAVAMRARFPEAEIISFEPLKDCYERLQQQMEGDPHFRAFNLALGEESGSSTIHRSASDPSSSLLPMAELHKDLYPHSASHTDETITIKRLDDVLKNENLAKPILIKIDVQGFEASVIKGGKEIITQSSVVLVENSFTTLYEGQALFGEVHNLLQGLGFSYRGRSETHYNTKTGEPIYEDSVFIKD
jgi:FkbM family methyltransferase